MAIDDEDAGRPERERAPSASTAPGAASAPSSESARATTARDVRDDRDDRDGLSDMIRQRLEALVPELVKKTFSAGMGAVFSTEEGIRKLARENLPEVAGYIASSADGAKDKVFEVIARETREFLSTLNLTEEVAKLLTTLSFEIKTEIRFIPNSERLTGAEPEVKASVRLKRNDTKDPPLASREPAAPAVKERDKEREDAEAPRDSRSRLRFWRRDDGTEGDSGGEGDR